MDLRQLGEFGLIDRIQKRFPPPASTVLGIGDDAAAILPSKKQHLLLTTDTLIEEVHFDPAFSTFQEVGYKSVMVNVSDIAAMGGAPRYILISLGLTGRQTVEAIDQLYKGIERASRETGLDLIGGNIAFSTGPFFISPTVVGEIPKKEMVTRAGAGEGDHLYVTGTLGDAAAGLALLKKGIDTKPFGRLTRRYRAPKARWREGRLLAKARIPSAMIDLSDGLSSDLGHLMERSGLGAEIDAARIPLSAPLRRAALQMGVDSIEYALNGGEDYELLFSVPERKLKKLEQMIKNRLISAYRIGKMAPRRTGLMLIDPSGRRRSIAPGGGTT
ncbi:MAG: thiamine-phosphate kinase [Candidatus Manganitrophus sp.]|nr:MAG: thiamine-phosphate kinase [Candidatus Manganitrophus sp.]